MNNAQRIAKLESLLARVVERRSAPRVAHAIAATPAPTEVAHLTSPAARPASVAPASRETPPPRKLSEPIPAMSPVPTPSSRASKPPPPLAVDDLPDLDLVETETPTGERRASLRPSSGPPASEAESTEFDIPAYAAPPRVEPIEALELETELDETPIQIDRAPLASATIPPARAPEHGIALDERRGPASSPMHVAVSAAAAARGEEVEEIEPHEELSAHPAAPQHYQAAAIPNAPLARVIPMAAPKHARTFRELLERSLSLRPRR